MNPWKTLYQHIVKEAAEKATYKIQEAQADEIWNEYVKISLLHHDEIYRNDTIFKKETHNVT